MDLNFLQIIGVLIVAFLAGMEGVLDEFEFHMPVVACTLIGLVTGQLMPCLILGGTLQMIALGWANVGAAIAPDAALAQLLLLLFWFLAVRAVPELTPRSPLRFRWRLPACC